MLRTRREDQIFEALVSGEAVEDDEFVDLSKVLATYSAEGVVAQADDKATDFAVIAARMARSGASESGRKVRLRDRRPILRLAPAAMALVLAMGMTGVAAASNAAGPGDVLYGIDRSLERVGINDGGLSERIEEANQLAASGSPSEALDHLADSLEPMSAGAAHALADAAAKVRAAGPEDNPSQGVREDVAGMLEWIAGSELSGREFGLGVAERARGIAQSPEPTGRPDPQPETNSGTGRGTGSNNGNGPPGGSPPGRVGS